MAGIQRRTEVIDCDCSKQEGHGTTHTYNYHDCGCVPCLDAFRSYDKLRQWLAHNNKERLVDSQRAKDRLELLTQRGMSGAEVSRRSGIHDHTLWKIRHDKVQRIKRSNEAKIMQVRLPSVDYYETSKK